MKVYEKKHVKIGRKPHDIAAFVSNGLSGTMFIDECKTRITINRNMYGPRGGIVAGESITLSLEEWEKINEAISLYLITQEALSEKLLD